MNKRNNKEFENYLNSLNEKDRMCAITIIDYFEELEKQIKKDQKAQEQEYLKLQSEKSK